MHLVLGAGALGVAGWLAEKRFQWMEKLGLRKATLALPAGAAPANAPATGTVVNNTGLDPAKARAAAAAMAGHIDAWRGWYNRDWLKLWQAWAGNLVVDGEYGPRTRGALAFYGTDPPPKGVYGNPDAIVRFVPAPGVPS